MTFVSKKAFYSPLIYSISLIAALFGLNGCNNPNPEENETEIILEQNTQIVQNSPQTIITEKLTKYYQDLNNGQIAAADYYAPSVERFFNSSNISRSQIDASLKTSIAQNLGRNLSLIPSSVKVQEQGSVYLAKIAGIASLKDASGTIITKDTFRNLIRFNQKMEIISYESTPSPAQSRKLGVRYGEIGSLINDLLLAFKSGKIDAVKGVVHPDLGAFFIYKTGLFPVVEPINALADINNLLPVKLDLKEIQIKSTKGDIPAFDCETEFEQQGCFYQKLAQSFKGLSETMEFANQAEKRIDESVLAQQEKIEQLITHQVVDTQTGLSLFLGESDGRWYVFVIDLALYDCSA